RLVKTIVPMRNPTTKHIAKYAALRAKSWYFFQTELSATAAGKFLTISRFEPGSASVPGFANVSASDRLCRYSGSAVCARSHASVGWSWSSADCGACVGLGSVTFGKAIISPVGHGFGSDETVARNRAVSSFAHSVWAVRAIST